ncbi:MAG TPA: hypothetical protein VN282_20025 [Pyrinomonadaceae bacterium]|nr:hypothetical protein [Pyrinomonadaceae bacterium]
MSECKVYRREIDEADGGRMSTGARVHAARCRACGVALREREALRALVGGLGRVEAPADFEFRLRARMAAAKSDTGRGRLSGARWFYGFAPVAVAACFVVVSATLYFRQEPRATKTEAPVVVANPPARDPEPAPVSSDKNERRESALTEGAAGQAVRVSRTDVASAATHRPAHRLSSRAARAREVASKVERRTDSAQNTADFSVTAAQVLHPIQVRASAEPLRIVLRDERGAERVVPMRSVSFGSQDFLARGAATRPATNAEVGGVW